MSEYGYLAHYGVKGMKWGVRKEMMKEYGAMRRARRSAYRKELPAHPLNKNYNKRLNDAAQNNSNRKAADKAAFEKKYGEGTYKQTAKSLSARKTMLLTAGALAGAGAATLAMTAGTKYFGKGKNLVEGRLKMVNGRQKYVPNMHVL